MGATQSMVSTDDFKNYIYGTVVLMLAPRLDTDLQFKEYSKIVDGDQHVLPLVIEDHQPKDFESIIQAYRLYYGQGLKDGVIDKYVSEHILDSEEHIQAFMKQLVVLLQERRRSAPVPRSAPSQRTVNTVARPQAPQAPHQYVQAPQDTQVPQSLQTHQDPQDQQSHQAELTHRIRGHGRLQRRMHAVDQAISHEHELYQHQFEVPFRQPPPDPRQIEQLQQYVDSHETDSQGALEPQEPQENYEAYDSVDDN